MRFEREQPNGYNEADAEWLEPWCDEHPDGDGQRCVACIGASHDAWMHRAKAAEWDAERLREALRTAELEMSSAAYAMHECGMDPLDAANELARACELAREVLSSSSDALRKEQQ
jgi:hypothetical protein